jgi:hypothetical protein
MFVGNDRSCEVHITSGKRLCHDLPSESAFVPLIIATVYAIVQGRDAAHCAVLAGILVTR